MKKIILTVMFVCTVFAVFISLRYRQIADMGDTYGEGIQIEAAISGEPLVQESVQTNSTPMVEMVKKSEGSTFVEMGFDARFARSTYSRPSVRTNADGTVPPPVDPTPGWVMDLRKNSKLKQ